jgi:outer membrane protein assembly factor BamD
MKLGNIKNNKTFEQIAPYRGKPQAEKLFYMFSQAYYKTEQYYLFISLKVLLQDILKVKRVQEAAYLGPKSYSMLSPIYSLDQTDT